MHDKNTGENCAYSEPLCEERHTRIDAMTDRFLARIEALEVCAVKLTQMIERYDAQLLSHETRIGSLERKPVARFERVAWYALCALLGAAATAVAEKFTWV